MDQKITPKTILAPAELVDYATDGVVSKEFSKNVNGGITLFAFDKGQRLSEHSAPFDAIIHVVDGKAEIVIDGEPFILCEGQMIIMPAGHPHGVNAIERFKMLLTMIKG